MLTDKRPGPATTRSRTSSIPTLLFARWSPTPIWCCPTRPISSAGTASRCSTGRSASADGAGRRHPPAGGEARPRRAAVPGRADRSRRAARAARPRHGRRQAALSGGYRRLHRPSRAQARHRPARRLARHRRRAAAAVGAPNPQQLERYIANGCFWRTSCRRSSAISSTPTGPISRAPCRWASSSTPRPIVLQLYSRDRCRNSASPRKGMARSSRRDAASRAHRDVFRSAADLVPAVRGSGGRIAPPSRCTRSRSGRWRCITPGARRTPGCARSTGENRLYMHRAHARGARHRRRRLGRGS